MTINTIKIQCSGISVIRCVSLFLDTCQQNIQTLIDFPYRISQNQSASKINFYKLTNKLIHKHSSRTVCISNTVFSTLLSAIYKINELIRFWKRFQVVKRCSFVILVNWLYLCVSIQIHGILEQHSSNKTTFNTICSWKYLHISFASIVPNASK